MNCPHCNSTNTRRASKLAYRDGVYFCLDCAIYFPSKKLQLIGVTGTNGKSSIVHYLSQSLGDKCAMIGTLGYGPLNKIKPTKLTTPDPFSLQKI